MKTTPELDTLIKQASPEVREYVAQLYASGDVTLNRAWIPPLYLTWD